MKNTQSQTDRSVARSSSKRDRKVLSARAGFMVATSVALTIVVGSAIVAKELYVRAGISGPLAAMAPTATSAVPATPASQSGLVNSAATANWEGEISDQAIVPLTPSEEDVLDFAVEMENQPLEVQAPLAPLVSHAKATGQTSTKTTDTKRTNQDLSIRYFNGRPVRPARTISMLVTAYTPDEFCCAGSADGITASLHHVTTNGHALVAADSRVLPLGSMITVPGYDDNQIVPVLDRGGKIKGNRLDVLFPDRPTAKAWGVRKIKVTVWEYADGKGKENWRKVRDSK